MNIGEQTTVMARTRILAKIRQAQTGVAASALDDHLASHPRGPQPDLPAGRLVEHFKERAIKLSSDLLETNDRMHAPALLANYLRSRSLPLSGVCWPALAALPWQCAGLDIRSRPAGSQDMVGITGAFCAIAETGTLMLLSGPDTPAATSLLPETHVAIVDPRRIVATMEDAWDLLRLEHRQPPRAVNFVSGPSRTADIEQTVTLGAHGPYRVLLIFAPHDRAPT